MKILVWVIILSLLGTFVFLRVRPYVRAFRKLFGALRDVNQVGANRYSPSGKESTQLTQRLLRCAQCNTFVPTNRAFEVRNETAYCSIECASTARTDSAARKRG